MNQSETNFYKWLVEKEGYSADEIEFHPKTSPNFTFKDREWEVKKLYGGKILLFSEDQVDYIENGGGDSYIAITPENPNADTEPLFILPCTEISIDEEPLFKDLEEWCVRNKVPEDLKYRPFSIRPPENRGDKIILYIKEDEVVNELDKMVERGDFKSRSHAIRTILKEHLDIEKFSEPF